MFPNLSLPELCAVFNDLWTIKSISRSFSDALVVLIPKTSGQSSMDTLRVIALFNFENNHFLKCLTTRIAPYINNLITPLQ